MTKRYAVYFYFDGELMVDRMFAFRDEAEAYVERMAARGENRYILD
jgi:hypothetical protein